MNQISKRWIKVIKNFISYRSDRSARSHGGAIIYSRGSNASLKILNHSNSQCEVVGIFCKKLKLVMYNIYCPPGSLTSNFKNIMNSMYTNSVGQP